MYIDMVGSTRMSTKLAPDFLSRIVTVFSQEVSYAIERCHGLVLKFNGMQSSVIFRHLLVLLMTSTE